MDQHFLKVTYHISSSKKMNAYLKMPSPTYHVLKREIDMCLFNERKQPRCEIRIFWIDEDQDEIEIINQCDYDIFLAKRSERQHLQVAPIGVAIGELSAAATSNQQGTNTSSSNGATTKQSKIPPAAGSYEFAVHDHVECDGCLMAPIMGFRYKCIQCPNYDLCQNCEAKHVHSEHMMVRMPTNNCPNVVEAYVTAHNSSRKHNKRSKHVKNGLSGVIDSETENAGAGQSSASPSAGKEHYRGRRYANRRSHGRNFLSHLYDMMHDLAEGGAAASAASTTGAETTGPITTNSTGFENMDQNIAAAASAAHFAAHLAKQQAHEAALTAAKVAHETALQSAVGLEKLDHNTVHAAVQQSHERAIQAVRKIHEATLQDTKNITENNVTPSNASTEQANEQTKEKVDADATTSANNFQPQPNNAPILPSPSLEAIDQFLDPQYMRTGMQILNNFSDMFAKMLDPMDGAEGGDASCSFASNFRKNSATSSTKSSVSSNLNSMESDKKTVNITEKNIEKTLEDLENKETKKHESDASTHVEIDDLGSDSENDSVSESFIKLDAPKESIPTSNIATPPSSANTAAASTPQQTLNKPNVIDFAQLSADLKAHIAAEEAKNNKVVAPIETAKAATQQLLAEEMAAGTSNETLTTTTIEPVVTTTTTTLPTLTNTTTEPIKSEEKRAVPVYHTDQRINNSVHAMMAMGFSNEGAWLTRLLESVNGNIADALDLMSVGHYGQYLH